MENLVTTQSFLNICLASAWPDWIRCITCLNYGRWYLIFIVFQLCSRTRTPLNENRDLSVAWKGLFFGLKLFSLCSLHRRVKQVFITRIQFHNELDCCVFGSPWSGGNLFQHTNAASLLQEQQRARISWEVQALCNLSVCLSSLGSCHEHRRSVEWSRCSTRRFLRLLQNVVDLREHRYGF